MSGTSGDDRPLHMPTWRQHHAANSPVRQPCSASWFRIVEDRPHKQGVARYDQRPLSRGSKLGAEMAFEARTAHPTLLWVLKRHLALWGRSARGWISDKQPTAHGHATFHGCREENQDHPLDNHDVRNFCKRGVNLVPPVFRV